jgi:radical SAM protein with 4Fe4S-binding SPASM domain
MKAFFKKILLKIFGYGKYIQFYTLIKYRKPKVLRLDIAATCNAQCPMCPREYMDESRLVGKMSLEKIKEILIDAKHYGFETLKVYITSEPTVHPDFNYIMKFSKELGFINHVSTNASLIPRALDGLKYVDNLQISVEGWDKESYEKFRYPLNFEKVYKNLKLLNESINKKYQNRYIHLPMTKNTDLRKFLKLWGEFVNFVKVDYMQPANIFSQGLMKSEYNPKIKDDYHEFVRMDKNFACFDPFAEIVVAYDGKIMLCCLDFNAKYNLGNIDEGFKNIINNRFRKTVKKQFYDQKLSTCRDCSMFYMPSQDILQNTYSLINQINNEKLSDAKLLFRYIQ